jgi:hypothetical protein
LLLGEDVSAYHVKEPGLKVGETINEDAAEEVLGANEDEVIRVHKERFPYSIGIVAEGSALR